MCVAYLGIKARLLASPGRKRSLLPRGEQGISTGRLTTWLYRRRRDADLVTFDARMILKRDRLHVVVHAMGMDEVPKRSAGDADGY
jgi:hypothetical protein